MTTPTETPEDLESLFNELSKARATGEELPDAPSEKSDPEPAAPAPAPVPVTETPIATPDETKVTAPTPAPAAAPAPPALDLSKLDQATRDYFAKIDNERRSAIGRAAALQREQDAAKRRQAATPAPAPAPAAGEDDPQARLAAEFPELAAAVNARVAQTERTFNEQVERAKFQAKLEVLGGMYPNWRETMESPEFNYWLAQQDEQTQKRFDSDSTRDYAVLLRSFELASAPPAAPAPASDVTRIKKDREARLSRSVDVPTTKSAPNPTGEPDPESDPEGNFNWRVRQRDKARERQQR